MVCDRQGDGVRMRRRLSPHGKARELAGEEASQCNISLNKLSAVRGWWVLSS